MPQDKMRDFLRRAEVSCNLRKWDLCIVLCDSGLVHKPLEPRFEQLRKKAIDGWTTSAHSYFNNRDYAGALIEYEGILKYTATHLEVIKHAIECAKIEGLPSRELKCLLLWVKNFPNDFDAYDRLGQFYDRTRNWEEAVKTYTKALEIKPSAKLTQDNLKRCSKNALNISVWQRRIEQLLINNEWGQIRIYADSVLSLNPDNGEVQKIKEKSSHHFFIEKIEMSINKNDFILAEELLNELRKITIVTPETINDYGERIAQGKISRVGYPELSFVEIPDTIRLRRIEVRVRYRLQAPLRTMSIVFNGRPLRPEQYQARAPTSNRPGEIVLPLSLEAQQNQIEVHIWDRQGREANLTKNLIYVGSIVARDITPPVITLLEPTFSNGQQGRVRGVKPVLETLDEISLNGYVTDEVAVASLSINGTNIQLTGGPQRCDFVFRERVRAISDTLRLVCIAKDKAENTASKTFEFPISLESEIRNCMGKTWAVLIANSAYTHLKDLQNEPYNDVEQLRQALSFYCFDSVIVKRDVIKNEFEPLFEDLYHDIIKEKVQSILIYYAGHGSYHQIGDSEWSYWVPVDGAQENRVGYLEDRKIREYLEEYNRHAKHILVIADCCFSGNLPITRSGLETFKPTEADYINLQKDVCSKSAFGIASGRKDEGVPNRSFFSKTLIRLLIDNRNLYIRDEDLAHRVATEVRESKSEQQPQSRSFAWSRDDGKFVFIRK